MKTNYIFLILVSVMISFSCTNQKSNSDLSTLTIEKNDYYVAAYVWPSCHDELMAREAFGGEGIGEWEMTQKGKPLFEGHFQPRVPLWGYQMDDDPKAWEQKIEAATDHGVNAFIFDWYWYDGKPFLEETVNEGFFKSKEQSGYEVLFHVANHNAQGQDWNALRYKKDTIIWSGQIDWTNYKIVVDRLINRFFKEPNYLKIDGKPVFSMYRIANFVKSFNGLEGTKEALDYFRTEVKKAGFPGLHLQIVGRGTQEPILLDRYKELTEGKSVNEIISILDINSITTYNWFALGVDEDYIVCGEKAVAMQMKWDKMLDIPYFPNVCMGRDDTPRRPKKKKEDLIHYNNSPESFGVYMQRAWEYLQKRPNQTKLITI